MNISERVKQLNLPIGKYVVVGGAMEACGIRKAKDLDIVVTRELFVDLMGKGWKLCECDECRVCRSKSGTKEILKGEGVDILSEYSWYDKYQADTAELIRNAQIIDGVPYVQLEELLKWKKAADRPKDKKDVELIEKFLRDSQ